MKMGAIVFGLILGGFSSLFFCVSVYAQTDEDTQEEGGHVGGDKILSGVFISEIFANPIGSDAEGEFIEIYNSGDEVISLARWTLADASGRSVYAFPEYDLAVGAYHVVRRGVDFTFALNNTAETLSLRGPEGESIDDISYETTQEGQSWNRDSEGINLWYSAHPTPGVVNVPHPRTIIYPTVLITEALPDPVGDESQGEYIEIYNPGAEEISLIGWTLRDGSLTGRYVFREGDPVTHIAPESYIALYRTTYTFALNNSGQESVSLIAPNDKVVDSLTYENAQEGWSFSRTNTEVAAEAGVVLHVWSETLTPGAENVWEEEKKEDYKDLIITEIFPNPIGDESEGEFIEIYNPHEESISLDGWVMTDASAGGEHIFAGDIIIAPLSYVAISRVMYGFALNNSGIETVTLATPSGDVVSSVQYEGSIEGSSYARKDSVDDAHGFVWTTTSTPGEKNIITQKEEEAEEEEVFVPAASYPELILSEILPHPRGDESEGEFIELYNPQEERVNLERWVLRDASQSGRYIFTADAVIEAQSYLIVPRAVYKFALNNTTETITLENPRGESVDLYAYKTTKEGVALAREGTTIQAVWRATPHVTPGTRNTFGVQLTIEDMKCPKDVYRGVSAEFAVEVNESNASVRWDFGDGRRSYKKETAHIYQERGIYFTAVQVRGMHEDVAHECMVEVDRYPRHDVRITAIAPNPAGSDKGSEYIEIHNRDDEEVDLTGWSVATGRDQDSLINHIFKEYYAIESGEVLRVTYAESAIALRNTSGAVELRRPDGSTASDVMYEYAENHSVPEDAVYRRTKQGWMWDLGMAKQKELQEKGVEKRAVRIRGIAQSNDRVRSLKEGYDAVQARLHAQIWGYEMRTAIENVLLSTSSSLQHALSIMQDVDLQIALISPHGDMVAPEVIAPEVLCNSLVGQEIWQEEVARRACLSYGD